MEQSQVGDDRAGFGELIPNLAARAQEFCTSADAVDAETLRLFAEQMRMAIRALHQALAAGDVAGIRHQAHSLHGMGGSAGAPEISVVGEELSHCAKRGDLARCADLAARLERWQSDWAPTLAADGLPTPPAAPRVDGRILVIDDELANRAFLCKLLRENGAEVTDADCGEQALTLARWGAFDVALVDVMLPGLSGYEVCRRLTTDPATCHIAVIMVTARSTVADVEHAFEQGAFDYIRKPFQARELLARVRNALQLKHQDDELRQWQARMLRELDAAGALQRKLMNTNPFFSRTFEIRSSYQSSMSVGGDVFDIIRLPNERLCLYVGDVSGHGVAPAMIATLLKALISEEVREHPDFGPAALCNVIHRHFRQYVTDPEIYATLFLAILDPQGQQCVALNCGHPMPLVFTAGGREEIPIADCGGLPIGLVDADAPVPYASTDEMQIALPPGAEMFVFTDGLLEAPRAGSRAPCGREELGAILAAMAGEPGLVDPAREGLRRLADHGYQLAQDDCTLLVVRTLVPDTVRLERTLPLTHVSVSELASELHRLLRQEDWPAEAADAVQLLVVEHGANVVNHARAPADSGLAVRVCVADGVARLLFRDHGREWDYPARVASSPRRPPLAENGRGLGIIRALARHIEVSRRDHENSTLYIMTRDFTFECVSQ